MEKTTVLSGNKLIAKFMGDDDPTFWGLYYESWDWLMPVVEKIESLGYFVKISTKMCAISRDNKDNKDSHLVKAEFGDSTKLEKLYNCVISTIEYINYKSSE